MGFSTLICLLVFGGQHLAVSQSLAPDCTYKEILDKSSGLALEWRVDRGSGIISMTIEADRVKGAIVLGLARRVELGVVDVVVCGIRENGTPYIHDMHGVNNGTVVEDDNHDWELISGERFASGRTVIRIQRALDTCDEQDLPISGELVHVVWNIRDNHDLPESIQSQGVKRIFFQDSYILPQSYKNDGNVGEEMASQWRLKRSFRMPRRQTSYRCSIHKGPSLQTKHHIVGFKVYHRDAAARRHVHHQILYRCSAPQGFDPVALFEPFVDGPGEECYLNANPQLPVHNCREMVYIDAVGSEPSKLPPQLGIPIGDSPNEYFLLEGHYDNQELEEIEIESGVDLEYSPNLRENDGSIIFVGHGVLGTFIQPPKTTQYNVVGHCSKECTSNMVPPTGIEIIGIAPHAHRSIQRMRLRHYREGKELPYIMRDRQFDFNYPQLRLLEAPVTILPGDQLTLQCGYDNRWANGSATTSGFSTSQEMCIAFLLLNQRIPYQMCSSEYPEEDLLSRFGIHNVTWSPDLIERVVESADNNNFVDLTLSHAVEQFTDWTPERVAELEGAQMFGNHRAACPSVQAIASAASRILSRSDSGELVRPQDQDSSDEAELPTVTLPKDVQEYSDPATCPQKSNLKQSNSAPTPIPVTSQRITLRRVGIERTGQSLPSLPLRHSNSMPGEDNDSLPRLPLFRLRLNRVY